MLPFVAFSPREVSVQVHQVLVLPVIGPAGRSTAHRREGRSIPGAIGSESLHVYDK